MLVGLVALIVPGFILLVRVSFVDALVVLDGAPLGAALRLSNALTAGRRAAIFWTGGTLLVGVFSVATILSVLAGAAEHFVVQVLADCAIAVTQSVFTIALFLFYWEARHAPPRSRAPPNGLRWPSRRDEDSDGSGAGASPSARWASAWPPSSCSGAGSLTWDGSWATCFFLSSSWPPSPSFVSRSRSGGSGS